MAVPLINPEFRVKFNAHRTWDSAPGFLLSRHANDFKHLKGSMAGTWQEPLTGFLMMQPSFLTDQWYDGTNWIRLLDWEKDPDYWQEIFRFQNTDTAEALGFLFATGLKGDAPSNDLTGLTLSVVLSSLAINGVSSSDTMVWGLQTSAGNGLARDEGFVIAYRAMTDEHHRFKNWFALQFDDFGFAFRLDGTCDVYQYDYTDLTAAPALIESFEICSPGDIANQDGYFIFIPIPGEGFSLLHSHSPQSLQLRTSAGRAGSTRGHLVRTPMKTDGDTGYRYVHDGGTVTMGVASRLTLMAHVFGMHRIRYKTGVTGTYTDAPFDMGATPGAGRTPTVFGLSLDYAASASLTSVTAALHAVDGSTFDPAVHHSGRVTVSMSTSDPRYTPIVAGTRVALEPARGYTSAGPIVTPDSLYALEFTVDESMRYEGRVSCQHKTMNGRKLVQRGSCIYVVEYNDTRGEGDNWKTLFGGIAEVESATGILDPAGFYYNAEWVLYGMEKRFSEITQLSHDAMDGISIGSAIDRVVELAGFAPIDSGDIPSDASTYYLPSVPQGQTWRYGTSEGDNGLDIIKGLLLFLRREKTEYLLVYDWDNAKWKIVAKPRNTTPLYIMTPWPEERDDSDESTHILYVGDGPTLLTLRPVPPEANIVQVAGTTGTDTQGELITTQPLVSPKAFIESLDNGDYLGRIKFARPVFYTITDPAELAKMSRRLYDVISRREMNISVPAHTYYAHIKPNMAVNVRAVDDANERGYLFTTADYPLESDAEGTYYGVWIKRIHTKIDYQAGGSEALSVTYDLSNVWQSEVE